MTWKVTSRIDPSRWLVSDGGVRFSADLDTSVMLADLEDFSYNLTPTGPAQRGVTTPSELFGAAWNLIPAPEVTGDAPPYPSFPSAPGVVY